MPNDVGAAIPDPLKPPELWLVNFGEEKQIYKGMAWDKMLLPRSPGQNVVAEYVAYTRTCIMLEFRPKGVRYRSLRQQRNQTLLWRSWLICPSGHCVRNPPLAP